MRSTLLTNIFNTFVLCDLYFSYGDLVAQAIYSEAIAMVEEYQQAISVSNLGGIRDTGNLYPQLGLRNTPQVLIVVSEKLV